MDLLTRAEDLTLHLLLGYLYVVLPLFLNSTVGTGWNAISYLLSGVGFLVTAIPSLMLAKKRGYKLARVVGSTLTFLSLVLLSIQSLAWLWPAALALGFVTLLGGIAGAFHKSVTLLYSSSGTRPSLPFLAFLVGAGLVSIYPEESFLPIVTSAGGTIIFLLTIARLVGTSSSVGPRVKPLPLYPSEKLALVSLTPMLSLSGFGFGLAVLSFPLWLSALGENLSLVGLAMASSFLAQLIGQALYKAEILGKINLIYSLAVIAAIHALMSQVTAIPGILLLFSLRGFLWGVVSETLAWQLRMIFRPGAEPLANTISSMLLAGFGAIGMVISISLVGRSDFFSTMGLAAAVYAGSSATSLLLTRGTEEQQVP